jgi:filamentous hemagglutinin family protein
MKQIFRCSFNSIALFSLLFPTAAFGQISPDGTVETNVEQVGNLTEITGGEQAGGNLFHSFSQFSVPTGNEAFFNNSNDINNIISRVTGGSISTIDGLIKANGNANLFLINPAGIIFGENARLDIGGSFLGSTANSLLFNDGTEFSAIKTSTKPLLTINAPIGLNLRDNPAGIENRSVANNVGLQVKTGENITLVGGDVSLNAGILSAPGGNVALGGIKAAGTIGIDKNGSLNFPDRLERADVTTSNRAKIDVSSQSGGSIAIFGKNVTFAEESIISADTLGEGNGKGISIAASRLTVKDGSQVSASALEKSQGDSGGITVNAGENVELIGSSSSGNNRRSGQGGGTGRRSNADSQENPSKLASDARGAGKAGDLIVTSPRLVIRDGARISASTIESNGGGSITVNASESVEVSGVSPERQRPSGLSVQTRGSGQAGDLQINTRQLTIQNGGEISASTLDRGAGGNIKINAADSVSLIGAVNSNNDINTDTEDAGIVENGKIPSRLAVETGRPRDIRKEGIEIGTGNAGNLQIDTKNLTIAEGAQISTSTFGAGKGGNLTVNAKDSIDLFGSTLPSKLTAETGRPLQLPNGEVLIGNGDGGNLNIETGKLRVRDGGEISVSSFGRAEKAGNLNVKADLIQLDRGAIAAQTRSGEGGNINLQIDDTIFMRNNSKISSQATQQATGGNLNIDSQFIIAFAENNDIVANAELGEGGKINIATEGIFGLQQRKSTPPNRTNDIDASSDFGLQGQVAIETPDINPSQITIQSPDKIVEPDEVIAQVCAASGSGEFAKSNSFIVTGKGGLLENAFQPLRGEMIRIGGKTVEAEAKIREENQETGRVEEKIDDHRIVPARGWFVNSKGQVVLTRYPTPNSSERTATKFADCHTARNQM